MSKVFIVAEIGCNHNGDFNLAKRMVRIAKNCGVDAVKFQTFKANKLISVHAPKAEYQKITTGSAENQLEMTSKLELPYSDYLLLADYARSLGLEVFSTPFDVDSLNFLANNGQKIWKIPSGELTNLPYLEKIVNLPKGNKIILSTGMASMDEIKVTVNFLINNGIATKDLTILHCNTEYPTPFEDVNLNAILHLKSTFPLCPVGLSDHSEGIFAGIASVALGINFIEKHFTLDKTFEGPDHMASITPSELKELCEGVRIVERSMGNYEKCVTPSEEKNKIIARKSIVASCLINRGEVFTEENLTTKRPGSGISPMHWHDILGKEAQADFSEDDLIQDTRFQKQD